MNVFRKSKVIGFKEYDLFIFSSSEITLDQLSSLDESCEIAIENDKVYVLRRKP